MRIVTRIQEMRGLSRRARQSGMTVGFVPTMGALHDGHLSLIRRAREEHHRVVVSVFVNPLQFGPDEDYARYPRNEVQDVRLCRDAGCDWFFHPRVGSLYGTDFHVTVDPGPIGEVWEGAVRPGHFRGVATVVMKLVHLVEPDELYLGQKDFQQARVLQTVARDLDLPVRMTIGATARERDGLALSSRNAYLSADERARAPGLFRAMREGRSLSQNGVRESRKILARVRSVLRHESRPDKVDYLAIVDPTSLKSLARVDDIALLIGAIRIGKTRLIDNLHIRPRGRAKRGRG